MIYEQLLTYLFTNLRCIACPVGYLLVGKPSRCVRLFTNYDAVKLITSSSSSSSGLYEDELANVTWYNYSTAVRVCESLNGSLADVTSGDLLTSMTSYFAIWRHGSGMGDVWVASEEFPVACRAIRVSLMLSVCFSRFLCWIAEVCDGNSD